MNIDLNYIKTKKVSKIIIGFSGGADSTALLILLNENSKVFNYTIKAIHFNHNLRTNSKNDELWCEKFCKNHNIAYTAISLDLSEKIKSITIEEQARNLRLMHFNKLIDSQSVIALGHHSDDRVENFLLRFARGANISGLTSLRPMQIMRGITIIRPLINSSHNDIITYLKSKNIDWLEDETNKETLFSRNFIRNNILPNIYDKLRYSEKGMKHSINVLKDDADFIENETTKLFESMNNKHLNIKGYFNLHRAIRIRFLRKWLSYQLNYDLVPSKKLFERINNLKYSTEEKFIPLTDNHKIKVLKDNISIVSNINDEFPPLTLLWEWQKYPQIEFKKFILFATILDSSNNLTEKDSAFFAINEMSDILIIREYCQGDEIIPFKKNSPVKLKKIFTDNKISSNKRSEYPILCDKEKILWIPTLKRSIYSSIKGSFSSGILKITAISKKNLKKTKKN